MIKNLFNVDKLTLAVDPGLSGAIAIIGPNHLHIVRDFHSLFQIARAVSTLHEIYAVDSLVIEQVGARPGQGVCSMFSFGQAAGVAKGALWALFPPELPTIEVHPLRWQNWYRKELNLPRGRMPEFDSRRIASRLLPEHTEFFQRKKDHNSADAALIGLWHLNQGEAA